VRSAPSPNAAVRTFAGVRLLSTAIKVAAIAVFLVLLVRVVGGP
jgi:hypothetical protein